MSYTRRAAGLCVAMSFVVLGAALPAGEAKVVKLPPPSGTIGADLFDALKNRQSIRSYEKGKDLPPQALSDVLWAACGKNRDDGKRTIPFAHNKRVIDLYVGMKDGCYFFNADNHELVMVSEQDIRADLFMQQEFHRAPVALLFVFNPEPLPKTADMEEEMKNACMSLGAAMQNVGLAAAAMNLGSVAVISIRKERIHEILDFSDDKQLILAMPVAYPK